MSSTVQLTCTVKHQTAKAILIVWDDQELWLPKSVIEIDNLGEGAAVVSIPHWLAAKHRLV
jgi:hypothetical protein